MLYRRTATSVSDRELLLWEAGRTRTDKRARLLQRNGLLTVGDNIGLREVPVTSIGSLTREEAALPVGTGSVPCREGSSGVRADGNSASRRFPINAALGHFRTRTPV